MKEKLQELIAYWQNDVSEVQTQMKSVGKYNFKYDVMSERVATTKLHIKQLKQLLKQHK